MSLTKTFAVMVLLGVASASVGSASILTFDSCGVSATAAIVTQCSGGSVNPNYGDRVSGSSTDAASPAPDRSYGEAGEGYTPNVVTSISGGLGWGFGYGLLTNVVYVQGVNGLLDVTFTADTGFRVGLLDFNLGAFAPPQNGYQGIGITVRDETNALLYNQTVNVGVTDLTQLINVQSGVGGSLTLRLDVTALAFDPENFVFDRESIGIDNIRFSQTAASSQPSGDIPEPSTFALVGGAALLAAWARKRR
jgi:hypothetical protein